MKKPLDLLNGPLLPIIFRLAGPAALMMLLQGFYNYVDTYFVGFLGADALAGISTASFILWMTFALAQLLSVGAAAKVARRIGEGDRAEADRTALRAILYAAAFGALVAAALQLVMDYLFAMMNTTAAVADYGRAYLQPLIIGMPLIFLSFMFNALFGAAGDTRSPLLIMFFSLAFNAFLDPILIFGLAGAPALGIGGAGWAAVAARLFWTLLAVRRLTARGGAISLDRHGKLGLGWRDAIDTARIGAPKAATGVLFSGVYMALTRVAATFGTPHIAALRIGHIYEGISFMSALGFSIASGALVGQNLGAGQVRRAARAAWMSAGLVAVFTTAVAIAFRLVPHELAGVFSTDPQVVDAAAAYLLILAWSQNFMGVELVLEGSFSGAGNTIPPMAVQLPLTVLRYPVAVLLAFSAGMGVTGIWWAISGSSILKCLLLAWWFSKGKWSEARV
jgi:putative MATE family efflux protein